MVLARSRAVPTRPSGWKPSKLLQGLVEPVFGDEPLVDRGGDYSRSHRVHPNLVRAELDGQVVGECVQPPFATE
jgi:hypothetical protein